MGLPGDLVRSVESELNRFTGYAASDLTQFENCVATGTSGKRARERYETYIAGREAPATPWMAPTPIDRWEPNSLKNRYEHFTRLRGGACIDFALAAAHLLANAKLAAKVRIEVVVWSRGIGVAHSFVLVGRTAADKKDSHSLDEPAKWQGERGDAWYLIDGWAGSLGHPVIYRKAAGYPFRPMLQPLTAVLTNRLA